MKKISFSHLLLIITFTSTSSLFSLTITLDNTNKWSGNASYISPASSSGANDNFTVEYTASENGTYLLEYYDRGRLSYYGLVASNTHTGSSLFSINGLTNSASLPDGRYTASIRQSGINYTIDWIYPRDAVTKSATSGRWKHYAPRDIAINTNGWVFLIFYADTTSSSSGPTEIYDRIFVLTNTNNLQAHDLYYTTSNGFWLDSGIGFDFDNQNRDNDCVNKMIFNTNNDMYVIDKRYIRKHAASEPTWKVWTTNYDGGGTDVLGSLAISYTEPPVIMFTYRTENDGKIFCVTNTSGTPCPWASSDSQEIRAIEYCARNQYLYGKMVGDRIFRIKSNSVSNNVQSGWNENYGLHIPDFGTGDNVYVQENDGNIYYFPVDTTNNGMLVSEASILISQVGDAEGKGRLYGFTAIDSAGYGGGGSNGFLYVACDLHRRLDRFSMGGAWLDAKDYEYGRLYNPMGVAISPVNGRIYITDQEYDKVLVLSPEGDFLFEFGGSGYSEREFRRPVGITCDKDGLLYVVDYDNLRVLVYRDSGSTLEFVAEKRSGYRYWDIQYNPANGYFYLNQIAGSSKVVVYNLTNGSDTLVGSFGSYINLDYNSDGGFYFYGNNDDRTCGLAVRNDGLIGVSDYYNLQLQAFHIGDSTTVRSTTSPNNTYFRGITTDPEGNFVVSVYNANWTADNNLRDNIVRFSSDLSHATHTNLVSYNYSLDNARVFDIALDGSHNMYVTRQNRTIEKFQPSQSIQYIDFVVDNTSPIGYITFPAIDQTCNGTINITGTVWDTNLQNYRIYYTVPGDPANYEVSSGTNNLSNAILGSLDMTSVTGTDIHLVLNVNDRAGNFSSNVINFKKTSDTNTSAFYIISNVGGTVTLENLTIYIPSNSFEFSGNINIQASDELLNLDTQNSSLGFRKPVTKVYSVSVDSFQIIKNPLTYILSYSAADNFLLNESGLALFRYDLSSYQFAELNPSNVGVNNEVNHLSYRSISPETLVIFEKIPHITNVTLTNINLFPNPVGSGSDFHFFFTLQRDASVYATIYTMDGTYIATIIDEKLSEGYYQNFTWDIKTERSGDVPNGVYLLKIVVNTGSENPLIITRKIIVLE
jgi:hypothetical protein